jgi:hypothetical protein
MEAFAEHLNVTRAAKTLNHGRKIRGLKSAGERG